MVMYKGIDIGNSDPEGDKRPIDSVGPYFKYLSIEGKRILDVGAHYGAFAVRAIERGAASVVSFEPTPASYKLLVKNTKKLADVQAYHAAVVSGKQTTQELFIHPKWSCCNTTEKQPRGSVAVKVPAMNLFDIIAEHKPQVLKMDCEGAEYDLLCGRKLPKCVKQVYMEIHYVMLKSYRERRLKLLSMFADWEVVREPKNNWSETDACWRRK